MRDHLATWLIENWPPLALAGGVVLILLVWRAPQRQVSRVQGGTALAPEVRFQLENEARRTLIQIVGGLGFALTAGFAWLQLRQTEVLSREAHRQTENKDLADRFSKAMEQLGDTKPTVRLGGVYSLERIARDSADDHWTAVEVLSGFVREQARWIGDEKDREPAPRPVAEDVQAALDVLGRRRIEFDPPGARINLAYADLRNANLEGGRFAGANLVGAHLEGVNAPNVELERALLVGAHLDGAWLAGAKLGRANLDQAHLPAANLALADLQDAGLVEADLKQAALVGTRLSRARLHRADLSAANLTSADLSAASLDDAILNGATLVQTNVDGASMARVQMKGTAIGRIRNLSKEQAAEAVIGSPPDR